MSMVHDGRAGELLALWVDYVPRRGYSRTQPFLHTRCRKAMIVWLVLALERSLPRWFGTSRSYGWEKSPVGYGQVPFLSHSVKNSDMDIQGILWA